MITQIINSFLFLDKRDCIINIIDNVEIKFFVKIKKDSFGKKRETKSKIMKKTFRKVCKCSSFLKLPLLKKLKRNKIAKIEK